MSSKTNNDERLLSRDEVEERFGVSKRFLELSVMDGRGPRLIKIGRSARYRPSDVRAWIASQEVGKS
jgi:predicted DNA-binding transcriptional regulator AlpA